MSIFCIPELVSRILHNLTSRELITLSRVNHLFHSIAEEIVDKRNDQFYLAVADVDAEREFDKKEFAMAIKNCPVVPEKVFFFFDEALIYSLRRRYRGPGKKKIKPVLGPVEWLPKYLDADSLLPHDCPQLWTMGIYSESQRRNGVIFPRPLQALIIPKLVNSGVYACKIEFQLKQRRSTYFLNNYDAQTICEELDIPENLPLKAVLCLEHECSSLQSASNEHTLDKRFPGVVFFGAKIDSYYDKVHRGYITKFPVLSKDTDADLTTTVGITNNSDPTPEAASSSTNHSSPSEGNESAANSSCPPAAKEARVETKKKGRPFLLLDHTVKEISKPVPITV